MQKGRHVIDIPPFSDFKIVDLSAGCAHIV